MKLPQSRYTVREKSGRLIVIDNWADGGPSQANTSAQNQAAAPQPRSGQSWTSRPTPAPSAADRTPPQSSDWSPIGKAPAGHIRLTTKSWYDDKAPRTVDLSPVGLLLRLLFDKVTLFLVIVFVVFFTWLMPILIVLLVIPVTREPVLAAMRRFATWRIDALGEA